MVRKFANAVTFHYADGRMPRVILTDYRTDNRDELNSDKLQSEAIAEATIAERFRSKNGPIASIKCRSVAV